MATHGWRLDTFTESEQSLLVSLTRPVVQGFIVIPIPAGYFQSVF